MPPEPGWTLVLLAAGHDPDDAETPILVEAATLGGRPLFRDTLLDPQPAR